MTKAIILVSFGTTHKDTRSKTIEVLAQDIQAKYPDYQVFQSFTSKIVRQRILENEGITYLSPGEQVEALIAEGYTEICLQSSHIICGAEFHKIYMQVRKHRQHGLKIKVSKPLLETLPDYVQVCDHLKAKHQGLANDEIALYMAHGTEHGAFTSYLAMDYMLENSPVFMACVESYPTLEDYMEKLKALAVRKIHLYPFMFVAGDHAKNDMASDEEDSWKSQLEQAGFEVEAHVEGLGEDPQIRQFYMNHLDEKLSEESGCRRGR